MVVISRQTVPRFNNSLSEHNICVSRHTTVALCKLTQRANSPRKSLRFIIISSNADTSIQKSAKAVYYFWKRWEDIHLNLRTMPNHVFHVSDRCNKLLWRVHVCVCVCVCTMTSDTTVSDSNAELCQFMRFFAGARHLDLSRR